MLASSRRGKGDFIILNDMDEDSAIFVWAVGRGVHFLQFNALRI